MNAQATHSKNYKREVKNYDSEQYFDRKESKRLDRYLQFAIISAGEAMADADFAEGSFDSHRAGVIWGSGIGGIKSLQDEVLDCFLVDRSGKILQRRRFSANTQDFATVKPEEMTAILAVRGVAGVVLVHNHPSARSNPTQADREMTKQIQWMCSFHNLLLCDHVVCGYDGVYSFYKAGELGGISRTCSIRQLLAEGNYGKE